MDIMAIVNTMQPGTISKQALHASDFPNDESVSAIPFMGMFVQLTPNGVLPTPDKVIAYEATYNAAIATQLLNTNIKKQIDVLEASQTPRRIRESIKDTSWMTNLESQIVTLRSQLK